MVIITPPPPPHYEENSLLVCDMKCRIYKDFKHRWMSRVFLFACTSIPTVNLIYPATKRELLQHDASLSIETLIFTSCFLKWYTMYYMHFFMNCDRNSLCLCSGQII
jgi:hypothetical protein